MILNNINFCNTFEYASKFRKAHHVRKSVSDVSRALTQHVHKFALCTVQLFEHGDHILKTNVLVCGTKIKMFFVFFAKCGNVNTCIFDLNSPKAIKKHLKSTYGRQISTHFKLVNSCSVY